MRATLALLLTLTLPALAQAASCRAEIGPQRAKVLVDRCIEVSPATHPPCNASNECGLIRSEIARSCPMIPTPDRPSYCAQYKSE